MPKTALVTGDAGFVGHHMGVELARRGWRVDGLDISLGTDCVDWFRAGWEHRYDLVVHCAAEVGGRAHIDGDNMALAHNLALDAAMFDWAVKTRQHAVVYYSSSAAYPTDLQAKSFHRALWEDDIDLDSPRRPDSNYGWSKLTGERLAEAAAGNGLRVHVLRPFSGCGHTQGLDYPWPSIARRARSGDFNVWGPRGQTRDWIDIDDLIAGTLAVVDADERRPVNLCTGVGTEMGELMVSFAERFGTAVKPVEYLADKPTGVFARVGDPSRFFEVYKPKKDVDAMIDETVHALRKDSR